nr:E3 ubiquitin-protein ligase SHPRH [Tanacetum cinerariifolium]
MAIEKIASPIDSVNLAPVANKEIISPVSNSDGNMSHPNFVLTHVEAAKLLNSLLKLRQVYCHPQVGSSRLRALQQSPMTMEEILMVLVGKTKVEGDEALRKLVVVVNGLGGIAIIKQEFPQVVSLYKEALELAEEHSEGFRVYLIGCDNELAKLQPQAMYISHQEYAPSSDAIAMNLLRFPMVKGGSFKPTNIVEALKKGYKVMTDRKFKNPVSVYSGLLSVVVQELRVEVEWVHPVLQLGSIKTESYKVSMDVNGRWRLMSFGVDVVEDFKEYTLRDYYC